MCVRVKDGRDRIEDTERVIWYLKSLLGLEGERRERESSARRNAESLDTHTQPTQLDLGANGDPCSSTRYKPDREGNTQVNPRFSGSGSNTRGGGGLSVVQRGCPAVAWPLGYLLEMWGRWPGDAGRARWGGILRRGWELGTGR